MVAGRIVGEKSMGQGCSETIFVGAAFAAPIMA